jgi:hypothetical protein
MTAAEIEAKQREILKKVRQEELLQMGGEESVAGFDHVKLRERLRWCTPLQKLYERVFFDGYDLAGACKQFDNFEDATIARSLFKTIILRDI